jgi:hypothetical protein
MGTPVVVNMFKYAWPIKNWLNFSGSLSPIEKITPLLTSVLSLMYVPPLVSVLFFIVTAVLLLILS